MLYHTCCRAPSISAHPPSCPHTRISYHFRVGQEIQKLGRGGLTGNARAQKTKRRARAGLTARVVSARPRDSRPLWAEYVQRRVQHWGSVSSAAGIQIPLIGRRTRRRRSDTTRPGAGTGEPLARICEHVPGLRRHAWQRCLCVRRRPSAWLSAPLAERVGLEISAVKEEATFLSPADDGGLAWGVR